MRKMFSFIGMLALALALVAIPQTCLAQIVRIEGSSMEYTLHDGEIVFVSKPAEYHRGDVVLCNFPDRTEWSFTIAGVLNVSRQTLFVKRLVALPGDTVEITGGKLYVNGEAVPDPVEMASAPRDYAPRLLGPDEYFVIGDNRRSSHDSRASDVGPLSRDMLQGKVESVIWPLSDSRPVQ